MSGGKVMIPAGGGVRICAEALEAWGNPVILLIGGATWSMDWWEIRCVTDWPTPGDWWCALTSAIPADQPTIRPASPNTPGPIWLLTP